MGEETKAPATSLEKTEPIGGTALVPATYTREQIDLIKNTVAMGASDNELRLFLHVCVRTGLDPLARQIYFVQRRVKDKNGNWLEKFVVQVGIDGFRLQAERTGRYLGCTDPQWCGEDGEWRNVWLEKWGLPAAAKVSVLRDGFPEPVMGLALYSEYCQRDAAGKPLGRWATAPAGQLAKCAEALALRRGFPVELSGLYADVELAASEGPEKPRVESPKRRSEKPAEAPAESHVPEENPWIGAFDEGGVKRYEKKGEYILWAWTADGGRIRFITYDEGIKNLVLAAMQGGVEVEVTWEKNKRGDAKVTAIADASSE